MTNTLQQVAALAALPTTIIVRAVDPVGPEVLMRHGDGPSIPSSDAGWQFTKRPRKVSMTEWVGPDPYTLVVPIVMDNYATNGSVEAAWETLRGIMRNPVGPRGQPAVVTVSCPIVPLTWLQWVIESLVPTVEYRRSPDGARSYIEATMTLYQWEPTDIAVTVAGSSPAQTVAASVAAGGTVASSKTYVVKQGDTLSKIAQSQLGDSNKWQAIRTLNNIRDPDVITVGQVLKLP